MPQSDIVIRREQPQDAPAVARLSARAFGPGRFARSAYRIREGAGANTTPDDLKLCAWSGEKLVGSLRFSIVVIGQEAGALLLGPLAIEPNQAGQGCGRSLIKEGLERARSAGHRLVLLVGDLAYYDRFGFTISPVGQMSLPGPVDPVRVLVKELEPGALADYVGEVKCAG
jgi:predicted N-acetyltransferase YhbS